MVKDKFTLTITDVNGSRHFLLSQIIKKVIIYFTSFVFIVIVLGALYINYLATKRAELLKDQESLSVKNTKLFSQNESMQKNLEEKAALYDELQTQLADIEENLGLKQDESLDIPERLEKVKLTNDQAYLFLTQIPNGHVIADNGITGEFGWRHHPILNKKEFHPGIDLRAPLKTPIYAPANGVVEYAAYSNNGYGYSVILIHNFGFKTVYAHMTRQDVVKAGEFVKKGQLLGYTGSTGLSTGPHLHYEVRFINKLLDPMIFINLNHKNYEQIFDQERRVPWQSLIKALLLQYPKLQSFQAAQK
ncbi:zinc metallopeptidase, M23 family [Campylobacter insulaenigrae]|uniref:zinc metallopeptidase, M23 family n=1 Tax=Campylobacter insulaenigrae TaxID=260714 RepID=UPI00068D73AB|nr:zinc metallopeptidase, M23 family [Campylobacter insulaenigrae]MCR6571218.1 zinc metallopeptidase, M23 family [Campylobacter insulaenigrae]MCR6571652.1 zinc metallopeptidase, M23 family [Campylobacter insulaenigrae]MCR6574293.1 zinc metallopeptidase, M23 family [Campylobacter insulaenigrae]MCR6575911.1 zinc metallopeptidase, M23 family [Campylobacter insulaenigrae]MCR6577208.1 zinc metallopeptidase, M23 family [Campylobacter insulaenigrae]